MIKKHSVISFRSSSKLPMVINANLLGCDKGAGCCFSIFSRAFVRIAFLSLGSLPYYI